MAKISDILNSKEPVIYTINSDASVESALKLMAEKGIGALIVLQNEAITGIFSERDFARKTLTMDGFHLGLPVHELMTSPVFFVTPDQSLEECMTLMTEKRIRHVPVMQSEMLIGLVSIRDVVKWLIADKTYVIRELERFVYSPPEED
jgi:CBS domain-containing protein